MIAVRIFTQVYFDRGLTLLKRVSNMTGLTLLDWLKQEVVSFKNREAWTQLLAYQYISILATLN